MCQDSRSGADADAFAIASLRADEISLYHLGQIEPSEIEASARTIAAGEPSRPGGFVPRRPTAIDSSSAPPRR